MAAAGPSFFRQHNVMKHTFKVLRQYFSLVIPFLWRDRACTLSTLTTFLLTVVDAMVVPLSPWLWSQLVRHYQEDSLPYGLSIGWLTALLIVCWLLSKTLKRLRDIVFFHVVNQAIRTIRLKLITHFHHIALRGGRRYNNAEILSASTRVSLSLRFCLRTAFLSFIPTTFKLITSAAAMQYAFGGSKYFLLGIALTYVYVFFAMRRFVRLHHHVWECSDQVMVAMSDSLKQRDFAKLHPAEEEKRLMKLFDEESKGWWQENIAYHSLHLVQNLLFFFMAGLFFAYLIKLLRQGTMDLPTVVLLKGYILLLHRQLFHLTAYIRGTSSYVVDMKKVLDILSLDTDREKGSQDEGITFSSQAPLLKLDNLHFHYPKAPKEVIQATSLTVQQGQKIAITGASGSGKSTLGRLMAGIYLPSKGDISFKGVSTRRLSPACIGQHLYFIGQDDPMIAGSIRDNLMTHEASELGPLSYLKEIIEEKQQEQQLSAGERQRVLLARCLSYRPQIVVLDEALSYLDEKSGRELLNMVLAKVPTVILLTHRKEFLEHMDRVYRLQDGTLST